ncbi:hypothetical protein [Streptomyces sp. NPDC001020]
MLHDTEEIAAGSCGPVLELLTDEGAVVEQGDTDQDMGALTEEAASGFTHSRRELRKP